MFKIVTTSSLIPRNGLDTLVKACALLSSKLDWQLTIAGDGPERQSLEILAHGLPVKFLGRVPGAKIPQLLHTSNIFVRPSRFEGFGSSFIEAMAAGLPVIGTPVGGITDFLTDNQTGLLVPIDDAKALAAAITRLATNKRLWQKLSRAGKVLVRTRYSWDKVAQQVWFQWQKIIQPTA